MWGSRAWLSHANRCSLPQCSAGQHVNYLEKLTQVATEQELLFQPYSVFTVEEVDWCLRPRDGFDSSFLTAMVTLHAAQDNEDQPQTLPTAPWS